MSARKRPLTKDEITRAFAGPAGEAFRPILSPAQLATMLGLSVKTIYEWNTQGRLKGAYRRHGKHILIWRDRVIDILFNGPEWTTYDE